jgi:hypothetical protein
MDGAGVLRALALCGDAAQVERDSFDRREREADT